MHTSTQRSGFKLALLGSAGAAFFWISDPRWGWTGRFAAGENLIDAANDALIGTLVGVVASAVIIAVGLWLLTRRTA